MMHVVRHNGEWDTHLIHPDTGCEQRYLQVPPKSRLYLILLYNLCIFREVKLQQHAGVVLETVEPIEGGILVNLYKAMNLEWLPVLMKLLNYLKETAVFFIFPQSLLP